MGRATAGRPPGRCGRWGSPLTAQELLYPHIFPFYIGASQYTLPWVTQVAELVGIVGLAPLIALVNGAVYELVEARVVQRPWARGRVLVPLGVLAATLLFGAVRTAQLDARTAQGPHLRAALIQTNLGASDKHTQADLFIQRHIDMSKEAVARDPSIELLVWPESAYNRWMPKNTAEARGAPFAELGRPLIFGVLMFEKGPRRGSARVQQRRHHQLHRCGAGDVRARSSSSCSVRPSRWWTPSRLSRSGCR